MTFRSQKRGDKTPARRRRSRGDSSSKPRQTGSTEAETVRVGALARSGPLAYRPSDSTGFRREAARGRKRIGQGPRPTGRVGRDDGQPRHVRRTSRKRAWKTAWCHRGLRCRSRVPVWIFNTGTRVSQLARRGGVSVMKVESMNKITFRFLSFRFFWSPLGPVASGGPGAAGRTGAASTNSPSHASTAAGSARLGLAGPVPASVSELRPMPSSSTWLPPPHLILLRYDPLVSTTMWTYLTRWPTRTKAPAPAYIK